LNCLSRAHERYRQTNRQTTDELAIAYSEREREFMSLKMRALGSMSPQKS